MKDAIFIKGARANNLKNIDVEIPRGKLVVITGISGSGKSSLAFDTLYAEGHRRFAESLSSFARQFLGRMSRPAVDFITGIPPAIAVKQGVTTSNPRSTIGTTTEINDYVRVLFAKIGHIYSPVSGVEVKCDTAKGVVDYLLTLKEKNALVAARIDWNGYEKVEKLMLLKESGFNRVVDYSTGEIYRIDDVLTRKVTPDYDSLALLVDRLMLPESAADEEDFLARALDSVETAFSAGQGHIFAGAPSSFRPFSNILEADGIVFEKPTEDLFSYNSPIGACQTCGGYGKTIGIDESLVIPNQALSVYEGAIACWRGEVMKYFFDQLVDNAYKFDFPIHKPYRELTPEQKELLWTGNGYFTGINDFFDWVRKNKYKVQYNYMLNRYSGKTTCRDCGGSRLRKEALYVRILDKNIAEVMDMSIKDLVEFLSRFENELDPYDLSIADRPLKEIRQRLGYMLDVGLGYLTLNRASNTLSGGESQRINLVTSLGNNLVGSLYILDEPSIGLHSRDTQRLIGVLKKLRDLGNTVVVVEHDPEIIAAADHLIDIGPYAGIRGGEIVYQGPPFAALGADAPEADRSITWQYLSGARKQYLPETKHISKSFIEVTGACENNLKNIDVKFPLKSLVVVTGVSGSGKSSLVGDILYPALYRQINQMGDRPGAFRSLEGDVNKISAVEYVDQNPIGKSSRS
ncbi:MAG: excinuclease ABC subunit A, partial [Bacteroidales bacterium]|nr:excinuclease ABC subunit A [Bacteroidales bacterium]